MGSAAFVRAARRRIIADNPTEISVSRTALVPDGGGRKEVKSTVGPFTVRLYSARNAAVQEDVSVAGVQHRDTDWALIADEEADLQAGPHVTDEFDVAGVGHFVVRKVQPQRVRGEIVGYAADLELVS